jgi:hypothetical protein
MNGQCILNLNYGNPVTSSYVPSENATVEHSAFPSTVILFWVGNEIGKDPEGESRVPAT